MMLKNKHVAFELKNKLVKCCLHNFGDITRNDGGDDDESSDDDCGKENNKHDPYRMMMNKRMHVGTLERMKHQAMRFWHWERFSLRLSSNKLF